MGFELDDNFRNQAADKDSKMTKVLLTGSSGFLGQHVLKALAATSTSGQPYHIKALFRSQQGFREAVATELSNFPNKIQVEPLDFLEEETIDRWVSEQDGGFDVCIHTAALSSPRACEENLSKAIATNNPRYFFDALFKLNPKMLIITLSTDHAYAGDKPPYHENDLALPVNGYGRSKVAMEEYLLGKYPDNAVVLRSSIILGPKAPILPDAAHETFVHFVATRNGIDTVFFTDERRNVVAVQDVVDCILWFVSASAKQEVNLISGCYNCGGPTSVSRLEIAKEVFDYLNFDHKHLVAENKADQPQGPCPSPLDISMNSGKLEKVTGLTFRPLREMLKTIL